MKYYNPENERIQYVVCKTLNGHVPTMLNIVTGQSVAITPRTAERYMERLAALNGWVAID